MPDVFIGDLPQASTLSANDKLVGYIGGTVKNVNFSTLKERIISEVGTWDNTAGKPFDDIDAEYFSILVEGSGANVTKLLSFSTEYSELLQNVSGDLAGIKDYISYTDTPALTCNEALSVITNAFMSNFGYSASYDSENEQYVCTQSSSVIPSAIQQLLYVAMSEFGYELTFDNQATAWKYTKRANTAMTLTNVYNAVFSLILGEIGYTANMVQGSMSITKNGSPYVPAQLSGIIFAALATTWGTTPIYDASTQSWSWSPTWNALMSGPMVSHFRSTYFDNVWTAGTLYKQNAVVVYNNCIYACVTENDDDSFTPAKWQKLGVTQAEFDALEARVTALENA